MSAYTITGLILLAIVFGAFIWCMFERGPCQPLDYKKKWWRK
jgi:hypothetical protein